MGANFRMAEIQAALGNVAVERFPEQTRQREEMAAYMDEALSDIAQRLKLIRARHGGA